MLKRKKLHNTHVFRKIEVYMIYMDLTYKSFEQAFVKILVIYLEQQDLFLALGKVQAPLHPFPV